MKKLFAIISLFVAGAVPMAMAHEVPEMTSLKAPEIQNLLTNTLEGSDGLEVIVSHVSLPPNVTLPKHWHPGEEIAYMLQGSVTLLLDGESEKEITAGEVGIVPLEAVHTARSGNEGATIIVFRVHQEGQPGRILVDE